MINLLISMYRAWPLRPHCNGSQHVTLCRVLGMSKVFEGNTRCPAKDA
jgi:hypothetical protein